MKFIILVFALLSFIVMSSLYISKEDKTLDKEIKSIKHPDLKPLQKLHDKFSKIDINSNDFDLNKTITEIKQARKLYPLDNTLLRIDLELEHKRANKTYKSIKIDQRK